MRWRAAQGKTEMRRRVAQGKPDAAARGAGEVGDTSQTYL
jgi:hypothetical protein